MITAINSAQKSAFQSRFQTVQHSKTSRPESLKSDVSFGNKFFITVSLLSAAGTAFTLLDKKFEYALACAALMVISAIAAIRFR